MPQDVSIAITSDDPSLIPAYSREGDAGMDLKAAADACIEPGQRAVVPCGIKVAIPDGFAGLVIPRSGLAAKHGITVLNAPGLIDSNYRGEICAILMNTDANSAFSIRKGDRIAQLLVIPYPKVSWAEAKQLEPTFRGESGFGSSGI
ncbi:MAG: dUTP diphosphatase [Eggerthellaceae bacterium]|nr:dUTP diphosphatase [Eggerthellaceae bacterium]